MFLPLECLEELKCCRCNRLLSVFPIYINKNDQQSSVCGRCQLPDHDNYLRCKIYENIAKNVRFPCINKKYGCMHNLLPKQVKNHERGCPYRGELCILAQQTNCKWEGPSNELYVHYKDKHKELLLKNNQFEFYVSQNHNFINILPFWREMFLFECSFDQMSKQLKCTIKSVLLGNIYTSYYVQIDLTSENKTITKKFPEIKPTVNQSESIDIDIETTFSDNITKVTGTVLIVDAEKLFDYNTELNRKLLEKMKCFKCKEMIFGSIYNCGGTHYTCEKCRTSCCSSSNYHDKAAQEAFKYVYHKCPYGCNFIEIGIEIPSHFMYCDYARIDCSQIGKLCNWQGAKIDFKKHLQNDHKDKILQLNEIVRLNIDGESTERFISYGSLYKLTVIKDLQKVSFRMERLCYFPNRLYFRFEISIFDNERIERIRISLPYNSSKGFNYELCNNQIKDIIFKNTLSFRLSILNC